MSAFVFKFSLLFFVIINVASRENGYQGQFLVDLVVQLKQSRVFTHLCWKKDDLIDLYKTFSKTLISHSSVNISHADKYGLYDGSKVFALNISCEGSVGFLTESFKTIIFDSTFTWIIFGELHKIKAYNFYFAVNSLVYIVETKENLRFSVKIIWKNNKADLGYVEFDVAEWKPIEKFLYFNKFSLSTNRTDLMRSPIRVSHVLMQNDSFHHLWDYRNVHTDKLTKINYVIISHLLEMLNASKIEIWSSTWGYRNEVTSTFNGMYGDLMFDRADLAGTSGLMRIARQQHFKFIPPFSPTVVLFIFQAPPLSYTSNIFTLPFTSMVWAALLSLIIFSSVLVYVASIFEWRTFKSKTKPNISDVVFLECSVVAQKGVSIEPKLFSSKMALYYTFMLCWYVYTGFSAYILVLLQSTSDGITDLVSLYDSKMEMGIENITYNKYYFTTPNEESNETLRRLIMENRITPKNNWFSASKGMERVRKGFFAFHVEAGIGFSLIRNTFNEKEKCKVRTTNTIFQGNDIFLAVPKNSVYTEMFLVGFRRIFETGVQKREHQKFYVTKPHCIGRHGNYDSIRLMDCYFPFCIFGFGLLMSYLIFICEIAYHKYNNAHE